MENDQSTTSTTTTTVSTSPRTQAPQISVYSSSDRQAVQVIQQALHRQPSTAAQYLQQMYAAQQQHLMLQTAALQQQHLSSTQLQSLAAVQQAGGRQSSSPTGSISQQSSVSQTSINLSASPSATQLISRAQTASTSGSGITQQAMLLGNTTPTLTASQAQMYLRAQMLIFTPTATVATVQPDIPVASSSSSSVSTSTQVQNLAVRSQHSGALPAASPQSVPLKGTCQAQQLPLSHTKQAGQGAGLKANQHDSAPESTKKGESLTSVSPETRVSTVTRLQMPANTQQLIAPEQAGPPNVTSASASVIRSSADTLRFSSPSSLIVPPAKLKTNGTVSSSNLPGVDNKPPQAIVKPQILTHVIEGFVIQEGLEPFPFQNSVCGLQQSWSTAASPRQRLASNRKLRVIFGDRMQVYCKAVAQSVFCLQCTADHIVSRSSLLTEQPVKQKMHCEGPATSPTSVQSVGELQSNSGKQLEGSLDSDLDDLTGEEGMEGSDPDMLKCEFCGKMDYAHKFRRSKRFCSMSCAKRYNVGCSKRMGLFKSDKSTRWTKKTEPHGFNRRGRRPNIIEGASADHFMRQMPVSFTPVEEATTTSTPPLPEETVAVAMTTRRRQNEREREREMREQRMREVPDCSETLHVDPTLWTVDHVWEFIHSLPGCRDIADEFRSQEIDGQALLLLKEDHLMSAMNIKLGPALKICARINMLKES
ncbi:polyhomeotic-like protein 3 [Rhincodon typus]|uniref:polyhomeotic-like protein 3 n=1 Tax=Rhincodon typus TaxID=259920 RepID=UPI00202FE4F5|nr:polyhomeotic-like protein 3 [Rhincodon typus]